MIARETIEQQVNSVYQTHEETSLSVHAPSVAEIDFKVTELNGALVFNNIIQTHHEDLYFDLERSEPLVMMYFQLRGNANFVDANPFTVPPVHHSINHVPMFRSRCLASKNSRIQNLCIKIRPSNILAEFSGELRNDVWLRAVESGEPMVTLDRSRPMNQAMQQNVHQLISCPYSGELGNEYRQSIVRLLLIQQLAAFSDNDTAIECHTPAKLTRADIAALHDLRQHLEVNFLEDVSIDKLARRCGLNSFKLKYGFRKLFNTSVMRFIDEQKMNYAKQLLLSNDAGDRFDLSDLLGYNHYSNFSTAFKKHTGCSPASFKKLFSNNHQATASALYHTNDLVFTKN